MFFNYLCFQREKARTLHNWLSQHQWKGKYKKNSLQNMSSVLMDPTLEHGTWVKNEISFIFQHTFFISILISYHAVKPTSSGQAFRRYGTYPF